MANTNSKCGFVCVFGCFFLVAFFGCCFWLFFLIVVVVVDVDVVVQGMLSTKSIKDPHHFSQGGVRQDLASFASTVQGPAL